MEVNPVTRNHLPLVVESSAGGHVWHQNHVISLRQMQKVTFGGRPYEERSVNIQFFFYFL